jgi:hypothetical protein
MSNVKRRKGVRSTHIVALSRRRGYKKRQRSCLLRYLNYQLALEAKAAYKKKLRTNHPCHEGFLKNRWIWQFFLIERK